MNFEKINKNISKIDEQMQLLEEKRKQLIQERDLVLAAQTQKTFSKLKIEPERLMLLKYAKGEQLEKLLEEIAQEREARMENNNSHDITNQETQEDSVHDREQEHSNGKEYIYTEEIGN